MHAAGPDRWPGGRECRGGDTMNALAANECWTVSRRLLGPLESMQRDAIVQSCWTTTAARSRQPNHPGGVRATIYRKIRQYGIITPAS
jgi:transcriptional regulator of acetoin/glycerol metabolism